MRTTFSWMTVTISALLTLSVPNLACAMEQRTHDSLRGIDVSHWDGAINWRKVAESGVRFAYIKASGGASFQDNRFTYNVTGARQNGIAVGAYHYARPTAPYHADQAVQQATLFVGAMKHSMTGFGELMPVLDLEETGSLSNAQLVQWVSTFAATVQRLTNRRVMLYTSEDFIQRHNHFSHALKGMPLWVAYYDRLNHGRIPPNVDGWNQWTVWQYSDRGHIAGISSDIDLNAGPTNLSALSGTLHAPDTRTPGSTPPAKLNPGQQANATNNGHTKAGALPQEAGRVHHQLIRDIEIVSLCLTLALGLLFALLVLVARVRKGRLHVPLIKLFHK